MNSKRKEILFLSGLILFSIILFIAGQGDLQYKIDLLGNITLVLFSVLVLGYIFYYILSKLFLNAKNTMRKDFFKISLYASIALFIMTLPIINYCDGWQTRQEMGRSTSEYLQLIGSISFLYFLFLGILYSVNVALTLAKYFKKKNSIKNVILSLVIPISGLIAVITFLYVVDVIFGLYENGRCDIITGPSDTGLSYILFISIIMNLIQYKISADNSMYEK